MAKLFIAADDFTGALDTGVKFASQGIEARVVNEINDTDDAQVTVINLNSRHLSRDAAYEVTLAACKKALKAGFDCIYIKTDSGLRGNIGAALEAAAKASGDSVIFAPAYPALNRRTQGGIHMIGSLPVTQSVFGRDLLNPVKFDRTQDIIAQQTDMQVVINGEEASSPSHIRLLELNTDEAMLSYAESHKNNHGKVYAGCAGFAAVMDMLLGLKTGKASKPLLKLPLLILSASMSLVNIKQLRYGENHGFKSIRFEDVLSTQPDYDKLVSEAQGCGHGYIIESSRSLDEVDELSKKGEQMGLDAAARGDRISKNMGLTAKKFLDSGFDGTLCLFGGDIVMEALSVLNCFCLLPVYEAEPGVVVSRALIKEKQNNKQITIVTKSGSFGSEAVINTLAEEFTHENQK